MTTSAHNRKIMGVLLAGGHSSRMGQDKALLEIQARSMLTRTLNLLESTSIYAAVVSRNTENAEYMPDIIANKGPLSGIHSAAHNFPEYDLLIVPVDLPLLDANTLQQLIDCAEQARTNVRYKNDNLPLFIYNTEGFRQTLEHMLTSTFCFSVGKLCSHFPITEITPSMSSRMFNANTPEQWRFAMQHFNHTSNLQIERKSYESFK